MVIYVLSMFDMNSICASTDYTQSTVRSHYEVHINNVHKFTLNTFNPTNHAEI